MIFIKIVSERQQEMPSPPQIWDGSTTSRPHHILLLNTTDTPTHHMLPTTRQSLVCIIRYSMIISPYPAVGTQDLLARHSSGERTIRGFYPCAIYIFQPVHERFRQTFVTDIAGAAGPGGVTKCPFHESLKGIPRIIF